MSGLSVPASLPRGRYPEFDAVREAVRSCAGKLVLDAGCGFGHLTRALPEAARVVGLDPFGTCLKEFDAGRPVHLIHGALSELPFADSTFDLVMGTQVLPHLPSHDARERYLREIARVARPEAKVVVTAMHHNFRFARKGIPKEGYSEGIYYYRYLLDEFRGALSSDFEILDLWGTWVYPPKAYWLYLALGPCAIYWERLIRNTAFALKYGKGFVAICRPKKGTVPQVRSRDSLVLSAS